MRRFVSPKAALFIGAFLVCEGVLLAIYLANHELRDGLAFAGTVVAAAFALLSS